MPVVMHDCLSGYVLSLNPWPYRAEWTRTHGYSLEPFHLCAYRRQPGRFTWGSKLYWARIVDRQSPSFIIHSAQRKNSHGNAQIWCAILPLIKQKSAKLCRLQTLFIGLLLVQIVSLTRAYAAFRINADPPMRLASQARRITQAQNASAVALDLKTGSVIFSIRPSARGLPGSAIKPLLLQYALIHNIVTSKTEAYCRRNLIISGRRLPCTHPPDRTVFTAETALAESCNTWFAQMGERFSATQLEEAFDTFRLPPLALTPQSASDRELTALGLRGPLVSVQDMVRAYAGLFSKLSPNDPVANGLRASVRYGMAHAAGVNGMDVLGKTGTAADPGSFRTHGWFAGIASGRTLLVVYVPVGDGGDAARLAHVLFEQTATNGPSNAGQRR